MKKIKIVFLFIFVFISFTVFAANPGRDISNKCRQNLKLLNLGTEKMLKNKNYNLPKWSTYKQAISTFLDPEKYLDNQKIIGPTHDCEYCIVSLDNNDFQWLCMLHGVLNGEQNLSLNYHEYVLQGKSNKKFMGIDNYKKHVQDMLRWTEYTMTPTEFFKYHYSMNPILTSIICFVVVVGGFILIKQFFKF